MLYLHMHPHVDLYNVHQLLQQGKSLNWEKLFQFIQHTVYNASLWTKIISSVYIRFKEEVIVQSRALSHMGYK